MNFDVTIMNDGVSIIIRVTKWTLPMYFHLRPNSAIICYATMPSRSTNPDSLFWSKGEDVLVGFPELSLNDVRQSEPIYDDSNHNKAIQASKQLQKHIGNHLRNFSLFAFLEPDKDEDSFRSTLANSRSSESNLSDEDEVERKTSDETSFVLNLQS